MAQITQTIQNNLSAKAILSHLNHPESFREIKIYPVLESTNITAKQLANEGAPHNTVVLSEKQTAGKGRLGRSFYSPEQSGIYMSVVLRLNQSIDCSLLITSAAAVAVCRAVEKVYHVHPQIKWVNDIYLNDRKICGILTEAEINYESNALRYMVLGIGVNISTEQFPDEIKNKAGSILHCAQQTELSRNRLIAEILNQIETVCDDLEEKSFIEEYKNRSCILGYDIHIITGEKQELATAIDINQQGHLIVKLASGEIRELNTGEISIRKVE